MKKKVGPFHVQALVLATVAMIVSAWLLGSIGDRADAQAGPDHSDLAHHHGFTGPGNVEDWPPRPVGAGTMSDADPVFSASLQSSAALAIEPAISPALAAQLGDDWIHISSTEAKPGKDGYSPAEETYFSRDMNQTVLALGPAGAQQILTFPPEQLQPVITASETALAAELGRQWLVEQGYNGAASLEGFGIRALDHGELYPVRMVYVTFATSWFDDPLYSALVDLTNGIVVEGGLL